MKPLLAAAILALVLPVTPALALMTVEEEQSAIEAACNGLELGAAQCACIAADAVAELEAPMRNLVLMSFEDEVGFAIRAKSGEFGDDLLTLIDYQQYVQDKCAPQ